ncbi:MAG: DUF2318 domain-containing protein [Deltaproteobacteria bacterium]|nr:DUF2318 domain-containing protein [Deltaproteobacteria bacterium]
MKTLLGGKAASHDGRKTGLPGVIARSGILFAMALMTACSRTPPEHLIVTATGNRVVLPVEKMADGNVHFFTFKHGGKNVNFFVRTDGNGRLHTHFDACYGCYQYKMGYFVEGNDIICRACRYKYNLDDEIWDYIGACAPITFKHRIARGILQIDVSILQRGARFF